MKSLLLLFVLILVCQVTLGQDRKAAKEQRKACDSIYYSEGKEWAVKFTPTALIVGEVNLSFEKRIFNSSSVELSIGPTISNIGIGGIEVLALKSDVVSLDSKIGMFVSAGYRFYPNRSSASLKKVYFSPVLKFRSYRTLMQDDLENLEDIVSKNIQTKLLFNFGVQLWPSSNFLFDLYVGIGLGYRKVEVFSPSSEFDGTQWRHNWVNDHGIEGAHLNLDLGVKIGFGK